MHRNTRLRRITFFTLAVFLIVFVFPVLGNQIHEYAQKGDLKAVQILIEQNPELVNAKDEDGRTPLHWACRGVHLDVVKFLVENGADVNAEDNNQTTPLHSLAYRGHTEGIKVLLDKGADVNVQDYSKHTPLHYAAISDSYEAAALLLSKGASLEVKNDYGRTPLLLCARERGGPKTTKVLLEAGANVNAKDKYDDTPLGLAAWRGKKEVIDHLLDAGAEVPAEGDQAEFLFSEAAEHGLTRLFQTVVKVGGDPTFKLSSGGTLVHAAAAGGAVDILESLSSKGVDINLKDQYGWTPLHYAARDGRTKAVEWLLNEGANINTRSIMGQSALNVAEEMKQDNVLEMLIAKGADTKPIQFPVLKGDCLGQKPPGDQPERFATGIVSSIWGLHSTVTFSPDGNTVLWTPQITRPGQIYSSGVILMMERKNGRWTAPRPAPFSGMYDDDVPFFTQEGHRLYFISDRPDAENPESRSERIWFVEREDSSWGEAQLVDPVVNDYPHHWQISVDAAHSIYFSSNISEGHGGGDIYCSKYVHGKWQKPENLGPSINTDKGEGMPYIAPDGSYLIFQRDGDLYISFLKEDGTWMNAVNLGEPINSPAYEVCPIVTPDGKYLFFLSRRDGKSHVWWVDAGFIARLKK